MASSVRDLQTLLSVLGITEERLAIVYEQDDLDAAFQQKGILELEERELE